MSERRHNDGLRKVCGCPRDRWRKCPHPPHFNYCGVRVSMEVQAGRPVTWSEAEILARDWRDEIDRGRFVLAKRGGTVAAQRAAQMASDAFTLRLFAARYLTEYCVLKRPGHAGERCREEYVFQPMLAFELPDERVLGDVPFAEVDETMYETYIASRRADGYAASTVNKEVGLIKAMCKWAARKKLFGPQGNPISGESKVLRRKPHKQRQRRVTDDDLTLMQKFADARLWAYIELALITCLRLTELYRLRWKDISLASYTVTVRADATKVATAARKAPLDDRGVAILQWLRINPGDGQPYPEGDYVFGECGEAPSKITARFCTMLLRAFAPTDFGYDWKNGSLGPRAQAELRVIDLVFSDLRHEGALRKYYSGWKLNELQALLGHTNLKQTSTYLGVGNEEVLRAMQVHGSGWPLLQSACNPALPGAETEAPKPPTTH